jgi:cysteine-rich repeat protein
MQGPSSNRSPRLVPWVTVLAATVLAGRAYGQCPGQCNATKCTVDSPTVLSSGTVFSCSKDIEVNANGTLEVAAGGNFTVNAKSMKIRGLLKAAGGAITVTTEQAFLTETVSGKSGKVDASSAGLAGVIRITGKPVQIANTSWVRATGSGGTIEICGGTRAGDGSCTRTHAVQITSDVNGGAVAVAGGTIDIDGSSVTIANNVQVLATSEEADGSGGSIDIRANGDVVITGKIRSNKFDNAGNGGDITVEANGAGTITVNSSALIQAVGGTQADDGVITLGPACSVTVNGTVDSNGGNHDGEIAFTYRDHFTETTGDIKAGGDGTIDINCRQNTAGTACDHAPTFNPTHFDIPPTVDHESLPACTNACGNGIVESYNGTVEECDDANFAICDGCENCLIASPTRPCDDGNQCTIGDVCNGTGRCLAALRDCDDGNPCTKDACSAATGCTHDPNGCQYDLWKTITDSYAQIDSTDGQPLTSVGADIATRGTNGVSVFTYDTMSQAWVRRNFTLADWNVGDFGRGIAGVPSKVIVGIPNGIGTNPGEVRIYSATTGAPLQTIPNPSSYHSYSYGWSVAGIGTNEVVAGALLDDTMGTIVTGSAYRSNVTNAALLSSYFAPVNTVRAVGWSVAAIGDFVAVSGTDGFSIGGSNAVMIFARDETNDPPIWTISSTDSEYGDAFGESIALLQPAPPAVVPKVVVSDADATQRAYLYDGTTHQRIELAPTGSGQSFGYPVAGVAGNAVVSVQGPKEARLFNGLTGTYLQSMTPPNGSAFVVVAALGEKVLVGGNTGVNVYRTRCGNNVQELGEECDDGNTRDGDCCSSDCQESFITTYCSTGDPCEVGQCYRAAPSNPMFCLPTGCVVGAPCDAGGGTTGTCGGNAFACGCQ